AFALKKWSNSVREPQKIIILGGAKATEMPKILFRIGIAFLGSCQSSKNIEKELKQQFCFSRGTGVSEPFIKDTRCHTVGNTA
ncbi:hypothetical protein JL09_g6704, partial [Pichia kudriavzevii]